MDYKKSYLLLSAGVWGGGIAALIGMFLETSNPSANLGQIIAGAGVAVMIAALLQAMIFYKCPYCGERFNIRGRKPDYCPKCGNKLNL